MEKFKKSPVIIGIIAVVFALIYALYALNQGEPKEASNPSVLACKTDNDCKCQGFDGARFLDTWEAGRCNTETGICAPCEYD